MREILFRGKRKDGKWVYGGFCCVEKMDKTGDEQFIIEYPADGAEYPVELNTVSQFTGLTDKNGKRIFEGDILSSNWGYKGEVEFDTIMYAKLECLFNEDCEIIGNIHDNPELMEVNGNANH